MTRRAFPYTFSVLTNVTALAWPQLVPEVVAQSTELEKGRTVSGTLAEGDTARYTVEVGDDYFVFGEVDQISVDVIVRVLEPDEEQSGRFERVR